MLNVDKTWELNGEDSCIMVTKKNIIWFGIFVKDFFILFFLQKLFQPSAKYFTIILITEMTFIHEHMYKETFLFVQNGNGYRNHMKNVPTNILKVLQFM